VRGTDAADGRRTARKHPRTAVRGSPSRRDIGRKGKALGLESTSYGITNRRAGYGSARVRGSDAATARRAAKRTHPRTAVRGSHSRRDIGRRGKTLGLESPSYEITNRRAGYGSTRVRGSNAADGRRAARKHPRTAVRGSHSRRDIGRRGNGLGLESPSYGITNRRAGYGSTRVRGSDAATARRAARTHPRTTVRGSPLRRDIGRKGKSLGLESPSYEITNRRAGYGSTRVRGSNAADGRRAARTHPRTAVRGSPLRRDIGRKGKSLGLESTSYEITNRRAGYGSTRVRGSDAATARRAARKHPRTAVRGSPSCRDIGRKGKALGLESPSYEITNRRAGYGSTRVQGTDAATARRAARTPADCRPRLA